MKKLGAAVAALALTAAFSSVAMAEPATLNACTKDGKSLSLQIDATGGIKGGKTIAAIAQQAWTEAAAESTAAELSASPQAFAKHLQLDIAAAIGDKDPAEVFTPDAGLAIGAPPTVGGNCSAPAPAAK